MGLTEAEIHQPFVGVASCWNEAAPCNIALMRQAQSAKKGVKEAGGTPREFCTITVTDGIAMGHEGMSSSLVSREVIADSVELTMRGHCYDALVGIAGCDKSPAGHDDGDAAPERAVACSSMAARSCRAASTARTSPWSMCSKASASIPPARCPNAELRRTGKVACPGAGACGGQFTANTMACVAEAIGLALPYSCGPPAEILARDDFALKAGRGGDGAAGEEHLRPRDIGTRKAFENAAMVVAATGGSTNAALHLPAMANEAGIKFDLFDVAEIFKQDALSRLAEAGRQICRQGHVGSRRRADADAHPAGCRPAAWRLHDRHRQDAGRESEGREVQSRPEGDASR